MDLIGKVLGRVAELGSSVTGVILFLKESYFGGSNNNGVMSPEILLQSILEHRFELYGSTHTLTFFNKYHEYIFSYDCLNNIFSSLLKEWSISYIRSLKRNTALNCVGLLTNGVFPTDCCSIYPCSSNHVCKGLTVVILRFSIAQEVGTPNPCTVQGSTVHMTYKMLIRLCYRYGFQ